MGAEVKVWSNETVWNPLVPPLLETVSTVLTKTDFDCSSANIVEPWLGRKEAYISHSRPFTITSRRFDHVNFEALRSYIPDTYTRWIWIVIIRREYDYRRSIKWIRKLDRNKGVLAIRCAGKVDRIGCKQPIRPNCRRPKERISGK